MPSNCREPGVLIKSALTLARGIGDALLLPCTRLALGAEGLETLTLAKNPITSFFKPKLEADAAAIVPAATAADDSAGATAAAEHAQVVATAVAAAAADAAACRGG